MQGTVKCYLTRTRSSTLRRTAERFLDAIVTTAQYQLESWVLPCGVSRVTRKNTSARDIRATEKRGEEQAVKLLISLFFPHFSPPSQIFVAVSPSSLIFLFLPDQYF